MLGVLIKRRKTQKHNIAHIFLHFCSKNRTKANYVGKGESIRMSVRGFPQNPLFSFLIHTQPHHIIALNFSRDHHHTQKEHWFLLENLLMLGWSWGHPIHLPKNMF